MDTRFNSREPKEPQMSRPLVRRNGERGLYKVEPNKRLPFSQYVLRITGTTDAGGGMGWVGSERRSKGPPALGDVRVMGVLVLTLVLTMRFWNGHGNI